MPTPRSLRHQQTSFEHVLWERLRGRRLEGLKFRRQHPLGPYVLDFYCVEHSLAIELDGSQHLEDERDTTRDAWLASVGVRVIRIWNHELGSNLDGVVDRILHEVARMKCPKGG